VDGDRGAYRVAVHLGQIAVEDDDVVVVQHGLFDCAGAVVRDVRPEAAIAQPFTDVVGQVNLVLHDEHPHGPILHQGGSQGRHRRRWRRVRDQADCPRAPSADGLGT